MQISIYDHEGIKFKAQAWPNGPDGCIHNNIAITSEGSTVRMWLTEDQCNALRAELDKLYPPPEQAAVNAYADEHAGEVQPMPRSVGYCSCGARLFFDICYEQPTTPSHDNDTNH